MVVRQDVVSECGSSESSRSASANLRSRVGRTGRVSRGEPSRLSWRPASGSAIPARRVAKWSRSLCAAPSAP